MIRSLRRKFVLITMGLVSLVLLAVLLGICLYYADDLRRESYRTLEMALERPQGDRGPRFQIGGAVPEDFGPSPVFVVHVGADGGMSLQSSEYIEVDEAQLADVVSQVRAGGALRGELASYDLRYLARAERGEMRIAFAALSLERSKIFNIFTVTASAVVGALIVFLIASALLARWALKPVERGWQKQRQFVADASHELKTPLTVILANMGIVKNHPEERVADEIRWIHNTEEEARRMKGLVDDMLFLAKGDDAARAVPLRTIDLSEAVSTAALSFEPVAFERGLELLSDIEPDMRILGDEQQIKQLVGILLDNAVKYAQGGAPIRLRLRRKQGQAELSVYNRGAPIAAEQRGRLFERFYRVDPSRSRPGYGLGLSIAKAIAENHRGRIAADSVDDGIVFTVNFPIK